MKTTNQIINLVNKVLFISLLLVLGLNSASAQNDWKLSTEKDGIKVYTSMVSDSKVKAIKVECDLSATPSQLVALIMDVTTAPDWVYHVKSAKLVKQVSPAELYYYSEVSLPWPAQNRDFVAHLIVSQDPDTKVVTIDGPAVPGFVPVKKGIVRIDRSFGKWVITPTGSDQLHVEYSIHVDPGGSLPAWLVNIFATDAPLQIFKSLKTQMQKPIYKNTALAFVAN
ncbi:START domain-containing protein [Mucilaginibacter sp. McL0603]|uniref:START domain-containing protein n=1 Tax=Mucilaginibacter sp. McL0603 TaxID=3415670 RepID=UPI003CF462CE